MLEKNLARLGIEIGRAFRHDWTQGGVPENVVLATPFDRVLIDAPCTNTVRDAAPGRCAMAINAR